MRPRDATDPAPTSTHGDEPGMRRRAYLAYFLAASLGGTALVAVLPLIDAGTTRVASAILPPALAFFAICFVALWLRPGVLRWVEVAQYAACYPLLVGLMVVIYGSATTEAGQLAAVASVAVWIPMAVAWGFIAFGSRGGPLASATFVAVLAVTFVTLRSNGAVLGPGPTVFALQTLVASAVLVVLLLALSRLMERQTASRITAEAAAEYAIKDVLTGVFTRFALGMRFEHAIALARRTRRRLAVALLDVDDFKRVNDDLGHAAGDEVLREVASRIGAAVRDADTVARLGGDEFVVLAFVDDEDHALTIAKRLVAVGDESVRANGLVARVGTTIGVSIFPDDAESVDGLLAAADAAMYAAKARGKGQAALASQAVREPAAARARPTVA